MLPLFAKKNIGANRGQFFSPVIGNSFQGKDRQFFAPQKTTKFFTFALGKIIQNIKRCYPETEEKPKKTQAFLEKSHHTEAYTTQTQITFSAPRCQGDSPKVHRGHSRTPKVPALLPGFGPSSILAIFVTAPATVQVDPPVSPLFLNPKNFQCLSVESQQQQQQKKQFVKLTFKPLKQKHPVTPKIGMVKKYSGLKDVQNSSR